MTLLQPGQMLGPYQIIAQIGRGGMATVYKAYHAAMDRYVALKVVAVQLADDPNFMQRFRQEARLIAKLEHPNILPVHDFGEADGIPYMVMRFIDSGTLQERLASGPLNLQEVDHIFSQLTNALEYAHENGVIHRDIKPSNAMLDKRGDLFLTDFGVAKMLEGSAGLTASGTITGTPSYMSPEQAQGLKVDQRSDIYSLGVVLFEMLTGRVPFEAETPMAVLFKHIQEPPPPLSLVRPDLPYVLEIVLLKALAKDPAERYASMEAFRAGWKLALAEASASLPAPQPASSLAAAKSASPTTPKKQLTPAVQSAVAAAPFAPPAKPIAPFIKLIGGLGVGTFFCLVVGAFLAIIVLPGYRSQANRPLSTETAAVQPAAPGTVVETPARPIETSAPGSSAQSTSWAGANTVYAIGFNAGAVLAAGDGGITTWNSDGSHKQITTVDGLPGGVVLAILVDKDGSLWAGTNSGLAHIDGGKHSAYTIDQGLDSDYVTALARGGERLFAGTQYSARAGGGLLEFSGGTWQPVPGFPSSDKPGAEQVNCNVNRVVFDGQGRLWVATEHGIAMLEGGSWKVFTKAGGLPDENVYSVYAAQNSDIFVGTANGGVAKFNQDKAAFEEFANLNEHGITDVYSILQDKNGNLWFAGGDVARYDPATDQWASFSSADGSFPAEDADTLGMDEQGSLYFGTYGQGLAHYAAGKFDLKLVPDQPRFAEYGSIIPAPDGKMIFSHLYDNTADEFDPANNTWAAIPYEQNAPRAFDAQGRMWSGGGNGLWVFNPGKTAHITTDHGMPSNQVDAIAFAPDGTAYIATAAGIAVFDGSSVKDVYTAAKEGLASDEVTSLFVASDGSLWAGTRGGFSRRLPDGSWQHFTSQELFGGLADSFPKFAQDHDGNIWVATGSDGVYRFSDGNWKRLLSTDPGVGLPSDDVLSVTVAPDGALWFGTAGQGAARYDGQTWKPYRAQDGLIDQYVNDIYVDAHGTAWFATDGGVTRLQP